jgi:hypothetical protein
MSIILLIFGACLLLVASSYALYDEHRARIRRRENYERLLAEQLEAERKKRT